MQTLTPMRALRLGVILVLLGLPALLAGGVGQGVWKLFGSIDASAPYFSGAAPWLLYGALPVVVLASLVLVMAPGLLLVAAFGRASTPEEWLLKGFGVSLLVLGALTALVQELTGAPLVGAGFVLLATTCTAVGGALTWRRARRGPIGWPAFGPAYLTALVGIPIVFLVSLTPKFFWEGFNGDGAHAYEATRLLLSQPLPFWPADSGNVGSYPGVTSILYLYPSSWFLRLFGEIEAAVRLPFVLFMGLLFAAIVGTARQARRERLRTPELALIWLAIVSYSLVMAYSATYDPYCSDIALPATQDTLLVACFLGVVIAFQSGQKAWMILWTLFALTCSPAGPLLIGGWLVAVVVAFRTRPWQRMAFLSLTLAGAVALLGALPIVLQNAGLPAPGTEHAPAALLSKFRYVLPTDFRRFLYLIVPCGIYPAVCFFGWRKADDGSRALLVVTTLVFGMYYLMAFVSLHYFVPAMILPLAVFWRMQRTAEWKGGLVPAAACGTLVVTAIVLALPRTTSIYTATRSVGARLDASDLAGYEDMDASYFRGMQLLEELFLPGWKLRVPEQAYAGAALSWSFYAQRTPPSEDETTYVLARAETPPPKDALQVASNGETTLYVLDEATWDEHRTMRPEGSRGRGIYSVPRDLLFRRERAFQRFAIIDIKGLLSRATREGQ